MPRDKRDRWSVEALRGSRWVTEAEGRPFPPVSSGYIGLFLDPSATGWQLESVGFLPLTITIVPVPPHTSSYKKVRYTWIK